MQFIRACFMSANSNSLYLPTLNVKLNMQLQSHSEPDIHIAPCAEDTSIDLLVPSYHHKCHICRIVLANYTRVVVRVNEPEGQDQKERYRNYCVSCLAQHLPQIAGQSLVLDYYVCPKITRKEQKLQNWSIGQISELFECAARFGESSTKQIHKEFTKVTQEDRLQKQLEMEYRGIYNQYFKNTPYDHMHRQRIQYILKQKSEHDSPINLQDYPLQDQPSVQSFLNLNRPDNYTQFTNGPSDKSYLCKDVLMSEAIRKIGSKTRLKQPLDEDSEELVKLLTDELAKGQLHEKDFHVASKLLCENFVTMQKRKSRAGRQSIEQKSQEHEFNIQHPELSKISKIPNLANAFDEVVKLKQKREDLLAQGKKQKSFRNSSSNSRDDRDQISRQHDGQSSSRKKEKGPPKPKRRSAQRKQ